jgi:glutamate/tyrosine decarboxylase-like PLP-dependent enzyme
MGIVTLPSRGTSRHEILAELGAARREDANWRGGRTWGLVYYAGDDVSELTRDVYASFIAENGLSPMAFPSLRKLETEVVAMTASLLGGGTDTVGNMTSGGSESILMAVKAARDWARAERPEVTAPEMVMPVSAHPAFEKAAHYLGLRVVRTPLGADLRADVTATRAAVSERTIFMMGSAPGYPHGVVDPIPELAAIAAEHGSWFHVDSCLGGFLLPFAKRLGYDIPPFDLRVPGVTSLSADVHKYGFAAKGASTILYRDARFRRYQFYVHADWPGGLYGTPTMSGARPGGAIAAAWAVMRYLGEEGYLRLARVMMETTHRLIDGINAIPPLRVLGRPAMTVFAVGSDALDVYAVADAMDTRRWHLDRQHLPVSLHFMVTPAHQNIVDEFLADLAAATAEVAARGGVAEPSGRSAMYGMMGTLPDRGAAKELALGFLDEVYRA